VNVHVCRPWSITTPNLTVSHVTFAYCGLRVCVFQPNQCSTPVIGLSQAEMERHRAQLADQAIEEQLEVQTAFREQVGVCVWVCLCVCVWVFEQGAQSDLLRSCCLCCQSLSSWRCTHYHYHYINHYHYITIIIYAITIIISITIIMALHIISINCLTLRAQQHACLDTRAINRYCHGILLVYQQHQSYTTCTTACMSGYCAINRYCARHSACLSTSVIHCVHNSMHAWIFVLSIAIVHSILHVNQQHQSYTVHDIMHVWCLLALFAGRDAAGHLRQEAAR